MTTSRPPAPAAHRRPEPLSWSAWREAVAVLRHPAHLKSTLKVAAIIGTLLFCINQLDVVLRGEATATVWLKAAITYLVPFCVSNLGVLIGSRRVHGVGAAGKR